MPHHLRIIGLIVLYHSKPDRFVKRLALQPVETKALQDLIAKGAIEKASKAATHDSKVIKAYRDWIAWLFAFGLIGLGMRITGKALKQAGGPPRSKGAPGYRSRMDLEKLARGLQVPLVAARAAS